MAGGPGTAALKRLTLTEAAGPIPSWEEEFLAAWWAAGGAVSDRVRQLLARDDADLEALRHLVDDEWSDLVALARSLRRGGEVRGTVGAR